MLGAARSSLLLPAYGTTAQLRANYRPQVSEHVWKQRVLVVGPLRGSSREERVYEFTMTQRLGGVYDGYWWVPLLGGGPPASGPRLGFVLGQWG